MTPSAGLERTAKEQEARTVYRGSDKTKNDSPAYECASYRAQRDDVVMVREVAGGTKTMREQGKKYLPLHPMEKDAKYEDRLGIAVAFNALGRTIGGLVGKVFRRDPVSSEDMDAEIAVAAENIDRRGHRLPVFLHRLGRWVMRDGHAWIHVEAPQSGAVRTRAEEKDLGIHPYWIAIHKLQAINWRYEIRAGEPALTLFVYKESITRPDGEFGESVVEAVRVLREVPATDEGPASVWGELWEYQPKTDKESERWVRTEHYEIDNDRVPVVFVPSGPTEEPYETEPPLQDLAYEQAEHYRVRSDRQKSLTFSSISVPYAFGPDMTDDSGSAKVKWGSDGMMLSNAPESKAGMIESQGHGLNATKEELLTIEARMASLGLQMLVRPSGVQAQDGRTTATSDIMRASEADASLVLFADALEMAANAALRIHAGYSTTARKPGTVQLNRDFHDQLIDPAQLKALVEMVASDFLTLETLWAILIEGEVLPEDFDPKVEIQKLDAQVAKRISRALGVLTDDADGAGSASNADDDGMGEAA